jgi:hypothetical protein
MLLEQRLLLALRSRARKVSYLCFPGLASPDLLVVRYLAALSAKSGG